MRQYKADILIILGILIFASIVLFLVVEQSPVDIQLHDTYFVLNKISLTGLIIGPLTFLIFFARGLMRKFRTKGANIGLIMGLILVIWITYEVLQIQHSYLSEVLRVGGEVLPERGQFIVDMKIRINWTRGLFVFLGMGLLILTLRTIKVWKEGHTANII